MFSWALPKLRTRRLCQYSESIFYHCSLYCSGRWRFEMAMSRCPPEAALACSALAALASRRLTSLLCANFEQDLKPINRRAGTMLAPRPLRAKVRAAAHSNRAREHARSAFYPVRIRRRGPREMTKHALCRW